MITLAAAARIGLEVILVGCTHEAAPAVVTHVQWEREVTCEDGHVEGVDVRRIWVGWRPFDRDGVSMLGNDLVGIRLPEPGEIIGLLGEPGEIIGAAVLVAKMLAHPDNPETVRIDVLVALRCGSSFLGVVKKFNIQDDGIVRQFLW